MTESSPDGPPPTFPAQGNDREADDPAIDALAFDNPSGLTELVSDPASAFPPEGIDIPAADFGTRVVKIGFDIGTAAEVGAWIVVPTAWTFDPSTTQFADGNGQHIEFFTSCGGECRPRAWSTVVGLDGGPLDQQLDRYGATASGVGVGTAGNGGHVSSSATFDDRTLLATMMWNNDAPLFVGCNVIVAQANADDGYDQLCRSAVIDWDTVIANAPEREPLQIITTPEVAALIDAVADGSVASPGEPQLVEIDDDGEHVVSIWLPDGTETRTGGFATEVTLEQAESLFTDITFSSSCNGTCEPKDWATDLNGFSDPIGARRAGIDLDNDAPIGSRGWILTGPALGGSDYEIVIMLWDDGAGRYFECHAGLDDADRELASTVISMCLSAEPQWFG